MVKFEGSRFYLQIKSLWEYRDFIIGNVKRDLQLRHSNTVLGVFWLVIHPLVMIAIYTIIFSKVMHSRLPSGGNELTYGIYICTGIIFWGLFTDITSRLINVFLSNSNMIKKINFPKSALLIILIISSLVNFCIIFLMFYAFLLISGNSPGIQILYVAPILLIQILFSLGLGLYLGVLNIFFRDIGQFFGVVLQVWFWVTPIVYPMDVLPGIAKEFISLNPMAILIMGYQQIIVYKTQPDWYALSYVLLGSIFLCIFSLLFFKNRLGEIIDEL